MRQIIINKNDSGQRLDKFITKRFKNMPKALMYKYIRTKYIKVNGKRCDISTKLNEGDVITLYIKDEFFEEPEYDTYDFLKAPSKLDVVYEDENIILMNKPTGLLCHPDENYHFDSLLARLQHYMYDKGEYDPKSENSFAPALANRIDRNTGGIVIGAKNAESLRILNQKIKDRELKKLYLCAVHGVPKKHTALLTGYLQKNENQNRVYISSKKIPYSKTVKTKYTVIRTVKNISLCEVELLTGRTHQIRAHMAYIGHPLVGDGKYGTNDMNKNISLKWQALCSYKLEFAFTTDGGILEYINGRSFEIDKIWFYEYLPFLKK
ncbi:MAG: RluA family pseudouridine synthase [Clostridia bacterium]|nr:RluA family pseudouridine synthase [Clostridia bacterium]